MSSSFSDKKIKIYSGISPVDWFSFYQGYSPLLSQQSINLYIALVNQNTINKYIGVDSYSFNLFCKNLNLNPNEFKQPLAELENLNLIRASVKAGISDEVEIILKVNDPLTLREVMKNNQLSMCLRQVLSQEKFTELSLITEEKEFDYEVNLNVGEVNKCNEEIIDKDTYCDFYAGVFKLLGSEFSLCSEVLQIIRDYYCNFQQISLKKLQKFSYHSIQEKDNKFFISPKHLLFLIKQELNGKNNSFNGQKYDDFWKNILFEDDRILERKFNELFSAYDSENLYRYLTQKESIPMGLTKWIKDCVQNKNFSFTIINAMISFVKTLLNKVPINYLIKLSVTLKENDATHFHNFIGHMKNVIRNDYENKDRLNINQLKRDEISLLNQNLT